MIRPPPADRMWGQHGADELDGGGQVGGQDGLDLLVGQFLSGAEDAVSGVADGDVDPPEVGDRAVNDGAQRRGVADVEHLGAEPVGMRFGEVLRRSSVCAPCPRPARRVPTVVR